MYGFKYAITFPQVLFVLTNQVDLVIGSEAEKTLLQ